MSAATKPQDDTLFVDTTWRVRQVYRIDPLLDRFFDALREGKLLGGRATGSERVTVPPRRICDHTGERVEQLEPVGPGGVIRALTQVATPFPHAPRPPYLLVFVQLDGASNAMPGYLRGVDPAAPPSLDWIGRRCRAVFAAERRGDWNDFWFEPET